MCARYVCNGAPLKCSFGDKVSRIVVYPDRSVYLTETPHANIADHESMFHIQPFGNCHSLQYPPTKSATDSHHGTLTPMPCKPGTITLWENGKEDYLIRNFPALLTSSCCKCIHGGIITVLGDGQNVNNYDMSRLQANLTEDIKEKLYQNDKVKDEDEGWTWLDTVELVPVVGSIVGIGRSAMKGDKAMVGANVAFLILDVAGVISFGAGMAAATAGKTTLKVGAKVISKEATKQVVKATTRTSTKEIFKESSTPFLSITNKATSDLIEELGKNITEKALEKAGEFFSKNTKKAKLGGTIIEKIPQQLDKISELVKPKIESAVEFGKVKLGAAAEFGRGILRVSQKGISNFMKNNEISKWWRDVTEGIEKINR